jgi:hypothetical protein
MVSAPVNTAAVSSWAESDLMAITREQVSRRVVLRPPSTIDDVLALADSAGWLLIGQILPGPEQGPNLEVRWQVSEYTDLHYVEDELAKELYLVAVGQDELEKAQVLRRLESELSVRTVSEVLAELDGSPLGPGAVKPVLRAGLVAPLEFSDDVYERLVAVLGHPEKIVRQAAVFGMLYTAWPQFLPSLRELAETDPDPDVRETARMALDRFASNGIGDS